MTIYTKAMFYHLIQTYQQGPRLLSGSLTRAAIIRICKRLTEKWGVEVTPEPMSDGFIQVLVPVGYKSCRLHASPFKYPWLEGDEMKTWANDQTVVFPNLKNCTTYLKGFDGASWQASEIIDICRALEEEECTIQRSSIPTRFKPYMRKYELRQMWKEKTEGLKEGDLIEERAISIITC